MGEPWLLEAFHEMAIEFDVTDWTDNVVTWAGVPEYRDIFKKKKERKKENVPAVVFSENTVEKFPIPATLLACTLKE